MCDVPQLGVGLKQGVELCGHGGLLGLEAFECLLEELVLEDGRVFAGVDGIVGLGAG